MTQAQTQYENSEPILKTIHNIINWFSEEKEMFKSIFTNNNKIQNFSMTYDFSLYNKKQILERNVFLWLMIALEGFYSKTVAYYFLHVKGGIPYDLIPQMWAVDFSIAFVVAFIITKLSQIGVRLGLEKYRELGGVGTKYHFFGFIILSLIPIINIWYKVTTDSTNSIVMAIVIPLILFIVTSFAVYIVVDRNLKYGARDLELKKSIKEKTRLEIMNAKMYRNCKDSKKDIEQSASKLSILLSKESVDAVNHYLGMFLKVEKYIIHDILFNRKPVDLAIDGKGQVEDLSEDEFYVFFKTL